MAWNPRMALGVIAVLAVLAVLLVSAVPGYSFPINYVSAQQGASVATPAKVRAGKDPSKLLSDGPVSKGEFSFADVQQPNVFTIDLGQAKGFDRIEFGSANEGDPRSPASLKIEVSSTGPNGPFDSILDRSSVGLFQVLRVPETTARWVRFDMGERSVGAEVRAVRIYEGYRHPNLEAATKLLYERIKPGVPGLDKFYSAGTAGDWKTACRELRVHFLLTSKPDASPNPAYDLTKAKAFMSGTLDLAGITRQEVVPIDWSYQKTKDWSEHKNFLNRGGPIGVPAEAYYNTGDKVWAEQFRSTFYDWIDANPKPTEMSGADYPAWRTLDSAERLSRFQSIFPMVTAGKEVDDELWANLLFSIWEHCDYLKNDNFSVGNWLAIISSSVMSSATKLPEFSDQKSWFAYGKTSFETNVLRDVCPDGKEREDAPGYMDAAYAGMLEALQTLDKAGLPPSDEARARLDRLQTVLASITQPDGKSPAIGDWGGGEMKSLRTSCKYFKRDDIRYIISGGKEGTPPSFASVNFPDGGWSVMRTAYDEKPYENAKHLVFKSSFDGHGHRDVLSVTAYACGRPLLIDPGMRSYEAADVEQFHQTAYHNTICVDGSNQNKGAGKTEFWKSDEKLDYVYGSHQDYAGLTHRRSVIFVKPDYWIVHDDLTGSGSHTYDQNWHFAEDAGIVEDPTTKAVHTSYLTGGNLLMVPTDPSSLQSQSTDFVIAKQRMGEAGSGTVPSKGWKYGKHGSGPQSFDTILYPYTGTDIPKVSIRRLQVRDTDPTQVTALEITVGDKRDVVLFSRSGPRDMKVEGSEASLSGSGDIVLLRSLPVH